MGEISEASWEKVHREAAMRMAKHDKLPPAKRMFVQQNDHLFTRHDMHRLEVAQLLKHRKEQRARWYHVVYGSDHPFASEKKPKVKRERTSQ